MDTVGPELVPGEQVRWTGMPSFHAVLLHALPSMVLGFGLAIAPVVAGTAWPSDLLQWIFQADVTASFLYFGLNAVYGALLDLLGAKRTVYAVTD